MYLKPKRHPNKVDGELQYANGGDMKSFLFFILIFSGLSGFSQNLECRRGDNGLPISLETMVSEINPGGTVFLGELHGFDAVAEGQLQILQELRRQGHNTDVALEFFTYTKQSEVDQFVRGLLDESAFLEQIGWSKGMDFRYYRQQALFPMSKLNEKTFAINAPQSVTKAVAKRGIENLTEEEKMLMPPNFEIGRAQYFERFKATMGGHVDEKELQRYFQAQSVWDETMAWQITNKHSENTLAVIVGEFHVQYGGGLPHRLSVRNPKMNITTIGFMDKQGLSEEQIQEHIKPHSEWGIRENYICLVDLPSNGLVWSVFKGLGKNYR